MPIMIPIIILLLMFSISVVHGNCIRDSDCAIVSGSSAAHVLCKASQCSCQEGYNEEHTFAPDGTKTEVTCWWIVPVWLWCLTHTIAFITPIALICCIGYYIRAMGRAFGPPSN